MLTTDGTNRCVKENTWCQRVFRHPSHVGPYLPELLVILTVGKEVAMVMLKKQNYINKAQDLFSQRKPTDLSEGTPPPDTKTSSSKYSEILRYKVD